MKNKQGIGKISQKGAILITLVVSLVIMAVIGSGMLYFSSTSSYGELLANRQERAYDIGESGANYALQQFLNPPTSKAYDGTSPGPFETMITVLLKLPNGQLSGDKFEVQTSYKSKDGKDWLVIKSRGTVGSGWLKTCQMVTKEIEKTKAVPPGIPPTATDSSGVDLGFDSNSTTQTDGNPLDSTWELATGTTTDEAYVNASGDLEFKTRAAAIVLNTDVVSLCKAWVSNGNLSSYFLQVKIMNIKTNPAYYMHGLSFRVQDIAASNSYGLSFYKHDNKKYKGDWCANLDWCEYDSTPQKIVNDGKIYAILWKRVNGVASLLAFAQMKTDTYSYDVTNTAGTELIPWSTLLIRVNERSDGNHLKAYVQSPSPDGSYDLDTINWNISSFKQITWTGTCNASSCSLTSPFTEVIDTKFSSTNLCTCPSEDTCTANRPEIGIHAFYDDEGAGSQLFGDFAMAVQGTSGGGSQY